MMATTHVLGIGKSRASELMQIADGRKTAEQISTASADRKRIPAKKKRASEEMPTAEEAEESYQETLLDQACLLLESMAGETRQKFFALVGVPEKLRAAEIKIAGLESEVEELKRENADLRQQLEAAQARAVPPSDDGLDIPDCLRRAPKAVA